MRGKSMNADAWSKQFAVLSISRLYLESLGFSHEKVASFTDEDLERIATNLGDQFFRGFDEQVRFVTSCFLIERKS